MAKAKYHLHLKGYVGGYDFDSDYVDYILNRNPDTEVHVLIDSLGGSLATALSIVAAFRNHANVHVHFVGMNASAATIASLGAKHVSIDSSAMYLVHKCSVEFFRWASANSDKLADIIKEAKQMKSDLEKMDANVAQMYATKCQKSQEELLALMKKGGWLTAQEALEWGFVDEITDYEEDAAPVITDSIAADMGAAGIPVPSQLAKDSAQSSTVLTRFIEALTNIFKSNSNAQSDMNPNNQTQQEQQQAPLTPDTTAQQQEGQQANTPEAVEAQHQAALDAKDQEIATLKAEIEALKKAPGASTSHVVEDEKKENKEKQSPAEDYCDTYNKAKALFTALG
ncbi:MAG: Clp protease ClpP [Prevotella sp.]|nr:Clp protease ClpP [Prevotella sp.]